MVREPIIGYMANPATPHDCKWINRFAERYHCVVFSLPNYEGESRLSEHIHHYPILPLSFPRRNLISKARGARNLQRIIRKEGINILHTLYAYPHGFWARIMGFQNHIITTRGSDVLIEYRAAARKESPKDRFFHKQFCLSFQHARFITATSKKQKTVIESFTDTPGKISVVRSGIDVDVFLDMVNRIEKPQDGLFRIFSPRSTKKLYNTDIIVKAFAKLHSTFPCCRLVLINDWPEKPYARHVLDLIRSLSLSKVVTVLPKQDAQGMARCYATCDIVVSIPDSDGTPNSVLEAMLARKQIILGACGYDEDLFGSILQLRKNTENVLYDVLRQESERQIDQEKLETRCSLVRQHASLHSALEAIDQLYRQCL